MIKSLFYSGINISFADGGKGKAIVLLHGYLESKEVWDPISVLLREKFRVIAIDLPGHGKSGVVQEIHTMEFMAGAVKAVLDSLNIPEVLMAGHSLGGYVALAFLDLYPENLSGYCLFHSHANPDKEVTIKNRKREIRIVRSGKKNLMYPDNVTRMFAKKNLAMMNDALERSKGIASGTSAEGIIAALNGMILRPSRVTLLEKGEKPLLWILGKHDEYFSPEAATAGVRLPSNAKVIILENSGHLGFVEEAAFSFRILSDFADSL